ncbi:MAG TPA: hypothetical protein VIM42_03215 [Clostridium sp.]
MTEVSDLPVTSKLYFPASIIIELDALEDFTLSILCADKSVASVVVTKGLTFVKEINITIAVIPFLMLFLKISIHSF